MGTDGIMVDCRVGRLLEIRVTGAASFDHIEVFGRELDLLAQRLPATWVTVADVRRATIVSDAIAQRYIQLMLKVNGRVERGAYLLGNQSLFSIQLEVMVLRARNSARRVFRHREAIGPWLGDSLTPLEQGRLIVFLDEDR